MAVFLEVVVVDEPEEGLEYEKGYYGGAKYSVGSSCGFVKKFRRLRQLDTNPKAT